MRYESLSYNELERLHTADPNNVNVAIALAHAAKERIDELEGEIADLQDEIRESDEEHVEQLGAIRALLD